MNEYLKKFTSLRFYFVMVSLTLIWVGVKYFNFERENKNLNNKIIENKKIVDSLNNEIYEKEFKVKEYEYILYLILNTDSNAKR